MPWGEMRRSRKRILIAIRVNNSITAWYCLTLIHLRTCSFIKVVSNFTGCRLRLHSVPSHSIICSQKAALTTLPVITTDSRLVWSIMTLPQVLTGAIRSEELLSTARVMCGLLIWIWQWRLSVAWLEHVWVTLILLALHIRLILLLLSVANILVLESLHWMVWEVGW